MNRTSKAQQRQIKRKTAYKSFSELDPESWTINPLEGAQNQKQNHHRVRELSDAGLYLDEEESSLYYNQYSSHMRDDSNFKINDFIE